MEAKVNVSSGYVRIVQTANRFLFPGSSKRFCKPFYVGEKQVGLIRPDVLEYLRDYPDVFIIDKNPYTNDIDGVALSPELTSFEMRSEKMAAVLEDLREKDVFVTLEGWRNECYDVSCKYNEPPIMKIERSGACLFGVKQYGVHINAYTKHKEKGVCVWIARRSKTKETFPGQLDQMVAGGMASGQSVMDCARKECKEEASVSDDLIAKMKCAGSVSYFYEDERGLFPEIQYVMDMEVPPTFEPVNADGEAESFQLVPVEKLKEMIVTADFKFNCSLVCLDFLIRHGYIRPEDEPSYAYLVQQMHSQVL